MSETTLFEKIIAGDIPGDIVFEDTHCYALRDINPQAPLHLLIIPRKPMPKLADASPEDQALLGHLMLVSRQLAQREGYPDYRVVINNGAAAGQSVFHLHIHLIAGRPFGWPPG